MSLQTIEARTVSNSNDLLLIPVQPNFLVETQRVGSNTLKCSFMPPYNPKFITRPPLPCIFNVQGDGITLRRFQYRIVLPKPESQTTGGLIISQQQEDRVTLLSQQKISVSGRGLIEGRFISLSLVPTDTDQQIMQEITLDPSLAERLFHSQPCGQSVVLVEHSGPLSLDGHEWFITLNHEEAIRVRRL